MNQKQKKKACTNIVLSDSNVSVIKSKAHTTEPIRSTIKLYLSAKEPNNTVVMSFIGETTDTVISIEEKTILGTTSITEPNYVPIALNTPTTEANINNCFRNQTIYHGNMHK